MPSDLSVPRVGASTSVSQVDRGRQGPARPSVDEEAPAAVADSKQFPNPTLRLDPGLALVVIEFRDGAGEVRDTIPTQAQLDAYRSWERNKSGTPPPGQGEAGGVGSSAPARDGSMPGVAQGGAMGGAMGGASPDTAATTDGSVATGGSAALGLSASQDSTAPRAATATPPVKGSSTSVA